MSGGGTMKTDPLEALLMTDLDPVAVEQLGNLIEEAEPYPWAVVESDDEYTVVVKSTSDPIASLPKDQYGKSHARLIAAAPLLALKVWNQAHRRPSTRGG